MRPEQLAQFCLINPKTLDYMPFNPGMWQSSERVKAMTAEQRAIYASILFSMWSDPTCSLEDDTLTLATAAKVTMKEFRNSWPVVSGCFFAYNHRFFSERLCKERVRVLSEHVSNTYNPLIDRTGENNRPPIPSHLKSTPSSESEQEENNSLIYNNNKISETNNTNTLNNNNNIINRYNIATRNSEYIEIAEHLRDMIIESGTGALIKPHHVRSWCGDIRLMVERDGRTTQQISDIIEEVFDDGFWSKQIRSAAALRQRWNEGKLDRLGQRYASSGGRNSRQNPTAREREHQRGHYKEGQQLRIL